MDGINPPLSYIVEKTKANRLLSYVPVRKPFHEMEFIASGRPLLGAGGVCGSSDPNKHNDSPHSLAALELSAKNDESQASHQFDGESYIEELEEFEKAMVVETGNSAKNGLTYFNEDEYPMDIEDDYNQHQDTNTSLTTESSDDATNTTITNRTSNNNMMNTIVDNNSTNSITLNSIPDEEPKEEDESNIFSATGSGAGSVDMGHAMSGAGADSVGVGRNTSGIGLSSVDPDGDGSSSLSQPPPAKKPKPTYSCLICPKSYRKRKSLIDHYKQHPGYCHDCGQPSGHSLEVIILFYKIRYFFI